ncbi:hypothetical protein C8Q74DRAFT_1189283 [Fomes fomentarius]|nr:hypothetical protein C8Q74DRAFT_1189283 [Fomes fomentarius]
MSSDSDLTDIEDASDEEYSPVKSGKSKGKSKDEAESGYRIRGALKVPRATTYTCQSLYADQISNQDVDLQPEYQRAVVWPEAKQIGLIDSIFRNFYVPPVIFVVHMTDDGGELRVCVDGKQRLTSIYRFIAGEVCISRFRGVVFTGEKFVFKDTGKIKAQLLPERYRKLFLNKQIVCMEYQDITTANEREIFQAVQLGMALTPAEKLQAITGPQADFVRGLLETYVVNELAENLSWDVSRANDFRGLATAVYSISRWPHLNTLPSLRTLETWLQESDDLDEDFSEDIHNTFRIFCALARDSTLSKPFWLEGVKKVAPMEFFSIAILIHANKKKMTMAQLSEVIGLMRKDVRKNEKDIRTNTRAFKSILAFLKNIKASKLKADGDPPAASAVSATKSKRKQPSSASNGGELLAHTCHHPQLLTTRSAAPTPAPALRTASKAPPAPATIDRPTKPSASAPPASASPRPTPSAPAALRTAKPPAPLHPSLPMPPPLLPPPPPRQNSLGSSIMQRMVPGSSLPGPNSQTASRMYDPSRDPRNSSHQAQLSHGASGSGAQWARR